MLLNIKPHILLAFALCAACSPVQAQTSLPFSPVVEANGVIYLAGQVGRNPETRKYPEGIKAQTKQTLDNIGRVLTSVNAGFKDVVRCQVFLTDPKEFTDMNSVYRTYFPKNPPASTTVAVALAAPAAKIEIECTAVRGHGQTMALKNKHQK